MSRLSAIAGRAPVLLVACLILTVLPLSSIVEGADEPTINEPFDNLESWEPFNFPKIKSHSDYASGIINGQWTEEETNMLEDYRKAFGQEPPHRARLAVMNDSDNTGEAALSYIDYIRVQSK